MVKHIVTFKLNGTPEERAHIARAFKDALMALPGQIDVLRLTAVVPTMADVEVYAKHPAHVAAAAILGSHKEARACVDYEF